MASLLPERFIRQVTIQGVNATPDVITPRVDKQRRQSDNRVAVWS